MHKRRIFILFVLLATLFLSGCSIQTPKFLQKEEDPVSTLPPEAIYVDGTDIYAETEALINSAQKSIYVEQTTFNDPHLADLLIEKAQAGLEVRVILDQWQTDNKVTVNNLKSHNISIQYYPARKGQKDRVKLLVVDNAIAFVYGPSWTADSFKAHNVSVKLDGRAARTAAWVFAKDWEFTTTLSLNVPNASDLPSDNIILARNANVKQQVQERITESKTSIWLELSEISDRDTVQQLIDASAKGIQIRLILDPTLASDTPGTIEMLSANGIDIRYYQSPDNQRLGTNVGIFDGQTFILSSSGWTYSTFVINHEFSITVPSPTATAKFIKIFNRDWETSSKDRL